MVGFCSDCGLCAYGLCRFLYVDEVDRGVVALTGVLFSFFTSSLFSFLTADVLSIFSVLVVLYLILAFFTKSQKA